MANSGKIKSYIFFSDILTVFKIKISKQQESVDSFGGIEKKWNRILLVHPKRLFWPNRKKGF